MICTATAISDVCVLEPEVFGDDRGFFFESYNQKQLNEILGLDLHFVQDNHSRSAHGVLRGLHYQLEQSQGKLLRVVQGEVFDVVVDIRRSSPTYGQWVAERLSAENKKQLWVPQGFAHGFYVCSDFAEVLYKATDYYHPTSERCIRWDDPQLNIQWPIEGEPSLSAKDQAGSSFADAALFA